MTQRKWLIAPLLAILLLAFIAGCGGRGSGAPGRTPERTGTITQVERAGRTRILVEGAATGGGGPPRIWLTITDQTGVALQSGGKVQAATPADLKQGQTVDVWIDGPVAESYPEQGTASFVLIR